MKKFLLAALLASLSFISHAAYAQAGCPTPNPNLTGPPFVDNCPLPAAAINAALTQFNLTANVSAAPVVPLLNPPNNVSASTGGSRIHYCTGQPVSPSFGCLPSSANFTTQFNDLMTTQYGASVSENGILSIVYDVSGHVTQWATGTGYTAGNEVFSGGNVYVANTNGTSGASAPTCGSGSCSDGSVSWNYEGPSYASAKQATNFNIISEANGGQSWGITCDNEIELGWNSNFATCEEADINNHSNIDPFIGSGTIMYNFYAGGSAQLNPITAELCLCISPGNPSTRFGAHIGMYINGPYSVKDTDIDIETQQSAIGIKASATTAFVNSLISDAATESTTLDSVCTCSVSVLYLNPTSAGSDIIFAGSGAPTAMHSVGGYSAAVWSETSTTATSAIDAAGTNYTTAAIYLAPASSPVDLFLAGGVTNLIGSPDGFNVTVGGLVQATSLQVSAMPTSCGATGTLINTSGTVHICP